MLDAHLVQAVRSAIEIAVSPTKVDNVTVVEGRNYDAEDVLYITVDLPSGTGPLPGHNYMQMLGSVNQVLLGSGEVRTPLFRTMRAGEEEPLEGDRAAQS